MRSAACNDGHRQGLDLPHPLTMVVDRNEPWREETSCQGRIPGIPMRMTGVSSGF